MCYDLNMYILKKASISLIVAVLYFSPNLAGAQNFVPCSGASCSSCHVVQMANSIIVYLIGMMFVIFAVMMVWAGFGMITSGGSPDAHKSAKNKLMNSFIGLIIVLVGWILVDTVMRGLLKGGEGIINGFGPWSEVKCDAQTVSRIVREGADAPDPGSEGVAAPSPSSAAGTPIDQSTASASFPADKFTVSSSGNCSDKNNMKCTSFDGIRPTTVSRIVELQNAVGTPFTITGGTETGHSEKGTYSHGNGYKVDIKPVPELNSYIYKNFTKIGPTKYQDRNGNTYYRHEPDHWDITITN